MIGCLAVCFDKLSNRKLSNRKASNRANLAAARKATEVQWSLSLSKVTELVEVTSTKEPE